VAQAVQLRSHPDFSQFELRASITGRAERNMLWACGGSAVILAKRRLAVENHWN
jgi:hypothetical protein